MNGNQKDEVPIATKNTYEQQSNKQIKPMHQTKMKTKGFAGNLGGSSQTENSTLRL